jgi:hypothetical protein
MTPDPFYDEDPNDVAKAVGLVMALIILVVIGMKVCQ